MGTRDLGSQEHEADPVFHVLAHKASTPPDKLEADVLAKIQALANEPSVGTAVWVHLKHEHGKGSRAAFKIQ